MGSAFLVESLPGAEIAKAVGEYLARVSGPALPKAERARLLTSWQNAPEVACIDALNLASITAFLDHVASLEGFADANEAIEKGRWRHLPYYIESCWVPIRCDMTHLVSNKGSFPISVCSAFGLLDNLAEIATRSSHDLGVVPPHFELMRSDPRAFFALQIDAFDERTMLQWIWRALFEGATLSIERNVPMWGGG
jgi:hypothetical protein